MQPIIEIFDLEISAFFLFLYLAFIAGFAFAWYRLRGEQVPKNFLHHIIVIVLGGAFVGAKTYYVFLQWEHFLVDPAGVFFSMNGSGWFGGFLLVLALLLLYFRRKQVNVLYYADLLIPAVPLGIFVGRPGCFLSGDGCYGVPTDLPWGMSFPNGTIPTTEVVHPTPLYEMLANIVIFIWLVKLQKRKPAKGSVLGMYLILSSIARFSIEFIRLSPIAFWGLTAPQIISLCLFAIGCFLMLRVRPDVARSIAILRYVLRRS